MYKDPESPGDEERPPAEAKHHPKQKEKRVNAFSTIGAGQESNAYPSNTMGHGREICGQADNTIGHGEREVTHSGTVGD